ncbi:MULTISPECIES: hypothetical protein [unclassified Paenibacillus]|uniref:hypothetical protein n=1 Tax=unclassified Paenibacillus TaxID=185978 RepID=UPI0003E205C2|nr:MULTISPECIES: hypothetical protein [unclassified Paenibacillus]ETT30099.1 hypothetical protein C162_33820 [Paenibacillus sp. FSL R7-269]OMF94245.1 hypothetical protein BK147_17040 [Paenibacillus sp. FSL R7-0337]
MEKKSENVAKPKKSQESFWTEERGDIGVKQIALTVAAIVIIGAAIVIVQGNLGAWISDIWDLFMKQIEKFTQ